jgi:hypothetical protein
MNIFIVYSILEWFAWDENLQSKWKFSHFRILRLTGMAGYHSSINSFIFVVSEVHHCSSIQ